jgi:hypothetical protein
LRDPRAEETRGPRADQFRDPRADQFRDPRADQFRDPRADQFRDPRAEETRGPRTDQFRSPRFEGRPDQPRGHSRDQRLDYRQDLLPAYRQDQLRDQQAPHSRARPSEDHRPAARQDYPAARQPPLELGKQRDDRRLLEARPPTSGPAYPGVPDRVEDPRAGVPLPPDHNGSASYQSLRPLPADDFDRPPSATGTGERPFLPPLDRDQLAQVKHGLERLTQEPRGVVDEDSEPTTPLPVILPRAASIPRPTQVDTPRGPFEPATPARPTSITGSVEPPLPPHSNGVPHAAGSPQSGTPHEPGRPAVGSGSPLPGDLSEPVDGPEGWAIPEEASEKLEEIKDLYLTAEAIGDDALDKHFEHVSQRQRELIKEFFERSHPANGDGP